MAPRLPKKAQGLPQERRRSRRENREAILTPPEGRLNVRTRYALNDGLENGPKKPCRPPTRAAGDAQESAKRTRIPPKRARRRPRDTRRKPQEGSNRLFGGLLGEGNSEDPPHLNLLSSITRTGPPAPPRGFQENLQTPDLAKEPQEEP